MCRFLLRGAAEVLGGFLRNRRAGIAVSLALAVVPVVGLVGLAADGARAYVVRAQLSQAVDSAALAGGRAIGESYFESDVTRFLKANFRAEEQGVTILPATITLDEQAGTVEVKATAELKTSFLKLLSVETITVTARAVVHQETKGMELVLVMDNTGSMRSGGKIDTMKQAAADLVNILYGNDDTIQDFWVGLVPYTATVNIGNQRTAWLNPYNAATNPNGYDPARYAPTTWKGCVEARSAPHDGTDEPPSVAGWNPHFWPSTKGKYGTQKGDNDWTPVNENNAAENDGTGPNLGCGPAITPLTAQRTTVLAAINQMLPWHRGGTMANLGLAWGWRVLSPVWRGLWGGTTPSYLPYDYDAPGIEKVVVLLTDGENQWYDWPGGLPGAPKASTYPGADYTAYGRLNDGRLGTTNQTAATTEINSRMLDLCTAMKAEGVRIYTIVFQLNNEDTQNLYRSCASQEEMYFLSPTNTDLVAAFHKIANELSFLRLAE